MKQNRLGSPSLFTTKLNTILYPMTQNQMPKTRSKVQTQRHIKKKYYIQNDTTLLASIASKSIQ